MKHLSPFLFFLTAICCAYGQTPVSKSFYSQLFNWRINIPPGFENVPPEQWAKLQNKGADAIEKTYETKVENNVKTLFVVRSDQFNYFEANYQPFDTKSNSNYLETFKEVNDVIYGTFEAQMPGVKLDSTYGREKINGLTFQTFKLLVHFPNYMTLDFRMYSRLFGNREFTVNLMTTNKEKQGQLLTAWRKSTFGTH